MRSTRLSQRWLATTGIGRVDRPRAVALDWCCVRAVPTMTPEAALPLVETFCEMRNPATLRDEVRLECSRRGDSITISERRPPWRVDLGPEWTELKIAQLRYDPAERTWSLYCRDPGRSSSAFGSSTGGGIGRSSSCRAWAPACCAR